MTDEELYDRNLKTVYGFFMAKTLNRQLAEDLTSTVFTTAFEQYRTNDAIQDKQKYLYGVMKLQWLQYLRQKYQTLETSVEDVEDFSGYAEQTIEASRGMSLIERALPYIAQLPDRQQEVLLLRFRDGLELKEICHQLNKNMNYVKTTQKRGLASLKRLVLQGGVQ